MQYSDGTEVAISKCINCIRKLQRNHENVMVTSPLELTQRGHTPQYLVHVRGCLLTAITIVELWLRNAYISEICITPMHIIFNWSATCSLAGVHVGRAKRGCFRSHLDTLRDLHGNHARQLIVKRDQVDSSNLSVMGWDRRGTFRSEAKSRPEHDITERLMTWAKVPGANTIRWPSGLDPNVISYRIRAYALVIYVGIVSVGRWFNLWYN